MLSLISSFKLCAETPPPKANKNNIYTEILKNCTFYPGFLLVCKMLRPCPDYHIYIVHTENLRK